MYFNKFFKSNNIKFVIFSYGISKGGRCMIADDMGLGKTIQALGIAHYFRKNWPLLIIVPSSMRFDNEKYYIEYYINVYCIYVI